MNIEDIKIKLLVKYEPFGSVIANTNFISSVEVKTAGTDGENIYYNPVFIESLNKDEQVFVFAHEVAHIAFDHIYRSEGKDKKLWNKATDSVINAALKKDGLPMVKGGVDIPEAINYNAEEMYEKLLKQQKEQEQNAGQSNDSKNNSSQDKQNNSEQQNGQMTSTDNQQEQNNSSSNSDQGEMEETQDVGHDTHSLWDKAIEKRHQEKEAQEDKSENRQTSENKSNQQKSEIEEKNKFVKLGEKEVFNQNRIERKKQLEELRKSLASQSHGYGSDTNSERRNITDIGTSKPLIDWRLLLREAIKFDIDWSYQNAGIEEGVVTPYLEEMPRPETEIVLDTSGSVNEALLKNFLRECKNILQTSNVKVGCFDTKFYGFSEIKDISDIDRLPFYGGGGTNFDVAVNAFTKRVENKIIFTDCDAAMPSTSIDAIWIVFGGIKIKPLGGRVIYIDDEQLERLYNYQMTDEINDKSR